MMFLFFPKAVWCLDSRGIAWKTLLLSTFRWWNSFWSRQPSFLSVTGRVNEGHSKESEKRGRRWEESLMRLLLLLLCSILCSIHLPSFCFSSVSLLESPSLFAFSLCLWVPGFFPSSSSTDSDAACTVISSSYRIEADAEARTFSAFLFHLGYTKQSLSRIDV